MHAREVTKLKTRLQEVKEESTRRHEESAHKMEEMRKIIEELTRAAR